MILQDVTLLQGKEYMNKYICSNIKLSINLMMDYFLIFT